MSRMHTTTKYKEREFVSRKRKERRNEGKQNAQEEKKCVYVFDIGTVVTSVNVR